MDKPEIKKSELINLQNEGLKRAEIAAKYDVSLEEMNRYFRILGIKGKAKKVSKFVPVDDTKTTVQE